jgi:hypothetical protein
MLHLSVATVWICTYMVLCDSPSCNSTSSAALPIMSSDNEIRDIVYNLATKIAPFFVRTVLSCSYGKDRDGYCSCVVYVRERKDTVFILCESEWNFPSGSATTSVTVEMVTVRVDKRCDGQRHEMNWYGVSVWYTVQSDLNHVPNEYQSSQSNWYNNFSQDDSLVQLALSHSSSLSQGLFLAVLVC